MQITKEKNGAVLLIKTSGRLDTETALDWGTQIRDELENINELILDFKDVHYLSSIGLREILELQKKMNEKGSMKLLNVRKNIMEIFELTGFSKILTIENVQNN